MSAKYQIVKDSNNKCVLQSHIGGGAYLFLDRCNSFEECGLKLKQLIEFMALQSKKIKYPELLAEFDEQGNQLS